MVKAADLVMVRRGGYGCYEHPATGVRIIRCMFEESSDYGDKAGDVYYIVKGKGWHSDPFYSLRKARVAARAAIKAELRR